MEEAQSVREDVIHSILKLYWIDTTFREQKEYINYDRKHGDERIKIVHFQNLCGKTESRRQCDI